MRARTKTCALLCTAIASFSLSGCGNAGPTSPSPVPIPAIHNQWTWVGGAKVPSQAGVYGTLGTPASTNIPGGREQALSWTDASGDFWLFGGNGSASSEPGFSPDQNAVPIPGNLNDLWKYSAGQWTWVGGPNSVAQPGVYGIQGTAAPANIPTSRNSAAHWVDASGALWLFGGSTDTVVGSIKYLNSISRLNDLWKYSAGQWTWVGGPSTADQPGIYGTQGTAAPNNIPGGRYHAVSWTDPSGNFWLFGGDALDANGTLSYLNDLWKYSAGQWTWISGSNVGLKPGIYGTQGTASADNVPGGREQPFGWTDASGNFWLFGGDGYDSLGNYGYLNDLWKYSGGQWTWIGGSNLANQPGVYGTQGTAAPGNIPGARNSGVSWIDSSGNLWLFGGGGYSATQLGYLNDLWKYSAGQWTWVGGSTAIEQPANYGTQGTSAASNIPGGRYHAVSWTDASGNPWLFGGNTFTGPEQYLNDLWKYQP
jgi:hypothetical protein